MMKRYTHVHQMALNALRYERYCNKSLKKLITLWLLAIVTLVTVTILFSNMPKWYEIYHEESGVFQPKENMSDFSGMSDNEVIGYAKDTITGLLSLNDDTYKRQTLKSLNRRFYSPGIAEQVFNTLKESGIYKFIKDDGYIIADIDNEKIEIKKGTYTSNKGIEIASWQVKIPVLLIGYNNKTKFKNKNIFTLVLMKNYIKNTPDQIGVTMFKRNILDHSFKKKEAAL